MMAPAWVLIRRRALGALQALLAMVLLLPFWVAMGAMGGLYQSDLPANRGSHPQDGRPGAYHTNILPGSRDDTTPWAATAARMQTVAGKAAPRPRERRELIPYGRAPL